MVRLVMVLLMLVAGGGCSVKLVYNNADRLAKWELQDLIDLDRRQEDYVEAEFAALLHWHRTEELPGYARFIRQMAVALTDGLQDDEIGLAETTIRAWFDRLELRGLPIAIEIAASLSDAQVAALAENMERTNLEILEPVQDLDRSEREQVWVKDYSSAFRRLVGRLTGAQLDYLKAQAPRFMPEEEPWVAYRRRWQADLTALLAQRSDREHFAAEFTRMVRQRELWYGSDYQPVAGHNEALYREISQRLINELTPRQRERLIGRLNEYAETFEELVADARRHPPPRGCLMAC